MRSNANRLGVARIGGIFRAVAASALERGDAILFLQGREVRTRNRYTIQIEEDIHLAPIPGLSLEEMIDRQPWCFLNHSCSPNAAFRGRVLWALESIREGEQVTFDYNTTEYELAEPFECACGGAACRSSRISGFKDLDEATRRRLRPYLAAHLRTHFATGPAA